MFLLKLFLGLEQSRPTSGIGMGEEGEAVVEPQFDYAEIRRFYQTIDEHNHAWREWFDSNDIEPYDLRYEDLADDPIRTTLSVLQYLGIELPTQIRPEVRNHRLADELSSDWMRRYRTEEERRQIRKPS